MRTKTLLWMTMLAVGFLYVPVFAADAVPAVAQPQVQPALKDGMVSLDFQDADIKNVLKVLAFKSGVNIVAGPEVTGVVSIQLDNVPWEKALDVILSTYGYGSERDGNIITVMTMDNLKKHQADVAALQGEEPLVTKTFVLSFAKATDVVASIEKMKSSRGSINYDQRTNAVIVRDVQENIDLIAKVIKTLDSVTPQVMIETKIVETDLGNTENMGIDWNLQASATGAKRPTTFPFANASSNKFYPGNFASLDPSTYFTYGTLDASQLTATMELLSNRSSTHVLSNPSIMTLDNQKATIHVGVQYPMPQYTYNQEQAQLQVSGWTYLDIGIIFNVTPHVNNKGLVTLELQPKITSILNTVTVENTNVPELSSEEADTKVMVKNGQTVVIAGLIKDQDVVTKSKVPLLGDLPLLGYFFRSKETTKSKTELMIFLTPRIITAQSELSPAPAPVK